MFVTEITPRFYETDAFGHINNVTIAGWFETGREQVFRLFTPDLDDPGKLPLILARIEIDFVAQTFYGKPVTLHSGIEKVGNSSFVVSQEAWQGGRLVARGRAVQVCFDHAAQVSCPIPDDIRPRLEALREEWLARGGEAGA